MSHQLKRGCTSKQVKYQQLGAPALVYYQKSEYDVDSSIATPKPSSIEKTYQRVCRAKFQFNIALSAESESCFDGDRKSEGYGDPGSVEKSLVPSKVRKKRRQRGTYPKLDSQNQRSNKYDYVVDDKSDYRRRRINRPLRRQRLGLMSDAFIDDDEVNLTQAKRNRKLCANIVDLLENYTTYDYPYIPGRVTGAKLDCPKLLRDRFLNTKRFGRDHQFSHPAYLAPFGVSSLNGLEVDKELIENTMLKDTTILNSGQGNCLVASKCPCTPCSLKSKSECGWCLIHPKGACNDRLCVSNLIAPNGASNAGHMFRGDTVSDFRGLARSASNTYPNELKLGDTILEVKQAGLWDASNQTGTVVVRTVNSICVLHLTTMRATKPKAASAKIGYDFSDEVCWGNYVIEEKHRICMHTLHPIYLSSCPTSLTCHPEYGNQLIGAKFAFSSQSSRGHDNVIHHYLAGDSGMLHATKHDIASLKYVSIIDFSSSHPMVLWSAASSYVRPSLSTDAQFRQPQLGTGSSLYAVDLRDNSATFQWSPSAQEMVTEGIHSINSIATDWQRDCILFVSSKSAGKTWEIDARMPSRSINEWSITYGAEDTSLMRQQKGFYRDGISITTSAVETQGWDQYESPCLTIDTTPGTHGLHVLQRPVSRATFQTDSVESVHTDVLQLTPKTSIARSSTFALPEISSSTHPSGIAALSLPMTSFTTGDSSETGHIASVLYTLVLTNTGDIYGYALAETNEGSGTSTAFLSSRIGANATNVPKAIEGHFKEVQHKHWKPTGGMNIRLFLTNRFPVTPNFLIAESKDQASHVIVQKRARKTSKQHQTRLLKRAKNAIIVDDKGAVDSFEFKRHGSGITISSASAVGAENSLLIPNVFKARAKKQLKFYKEADSLTTEEPSNQPTSDLSFDLLRKAKSLWSDDTREADS